MALDNRNITSFSFLEDPGTLIPGGTVTLTITATNDDLLSAADFSVGNSAQGANNTYIGGNVSTGINQVQFVDVVGANAVDVIVTHGPLTVPDSISSLHIDIDERKLQQDVEIKGCTDPSAYNYNPNATVDDGSCVFDPIDFEYFCGDPNALNYEPNLPANGVYDNNLCEYRAPTEYCGDPEATNYTPVLPANGVYNNEVCVYAPPEEPKLGFAVRFLFLNGASANQTGQLVGPHPNDNYTIEVETVTPDGNSGQLRSNTYPDSWMRDLPGFIDINGSARETHEDDDTSVIVYAHEDSEFVPWVVPAVAQNAWDQAIYNPEGVVAYVTYTAKPGYYFPNAPGDGFGVAATYFNYQYNAFEPYQVEQEDSTFDEEGRLTSRTLKVLIKVPWPDELTDSTYNPREGGLYPDPAITNINSFPSAIIPNNEEPDGVTVKGIPGVPSDDFYVGFTSIGEDISQSFGGGNVIIFQKSRVQAVDQNAVPKNQVRSVNVEIPNTKYKSSGRIAIAHGPEASFEFYLKNETSGEFYNFTEGKFSKNRGGGAAVVDRSYTSKSSFVFYQDQITANAKLSYYVVPTKGTTMKPGVPTVSSPASKTKRIDTTVSLEFTTDNTSNWTLPSAVTISDRPFKEPKANTPKVYPDVSIDFMDGQPGCKKFEMTATFSSSGGKTGFTKSRDAKAGDLVQPNTEITEDNLLNSTVEIKGLTTTTVANTSVTIKGLIKVYEFGTSNETFKINIDNFITLT